MIIWLIRYFRGFLDIKLDGVYSEKVLSDFAKAKITVWRLKYKSTSIYCRIFANDFKKIRSIRKKTGVRVRIIKKHGFPFFARRYRHRFGFVAGAAIFLAALKLLSGFIWVINIDGNKYVKSREILGTLKEIGIYESIRKTKIDSKNDAQSLLINRNDLAWASLNIEGCVLNVNVSEIKKTKKNDNSVPTNIIAGCDGIIRKIDAVSGDVRVKVGENVHKGDVLVSGIIESLSSTVFVRSNAVVTAQIEKSFKTREDYRKKVKTPTGKVKKQTVIELFGIKFPLFLGSRHTDVNINYKVTNGTLFGKRIPVKLYDKRLEYYRENAVISSDEEIENILKKRFDKFLNETEIDGYIPISTSYSSDSTGVTLVSRYLCDENIGVQSDIIIDQ